MWLGEKIIIEIFLWANKQLIPKFVHRWYYTFKAAKKVLKNQNEKFSKISSNKITYETSLLIHLWTHLMNFSTKNFTFINHFIKFFFLFVKFF